MGPHHETQNKGKEIKGSFSYYHLVFPSLREASNVYAIILNVHWEQEAFSDSKFATPFSSS